MKALALALVLVAGTAEAGVHVTPGDDAVIVHVDGAAVGGTVTTRANQIDVPLLRGAEVDQDVRIPDRLVRKVELGDGKVRIKLRTSRKRTRAISAAVQVRAAGADLEIVIPRDPRSAAVAPIAVTPTAPAPAPAPAPVPAPLTTATEAPPIEMPPETAPEAAPDAAPPPVARASSSRIPWGSVLIVLGVIAAAALALRRKRSRAAGASLAALEVRTTLSVGAKARVLLLSANDRELLVSVDARGVRLLDAWTRESTRDDGPITAPPEARARRAEPRPSPVAGLMRLRRTSAPATDADAESNADDWARELMHTLDDKRSPS